jgi:hypothetical protein
MEEDTSKSDCSSEHNSSDFEESNEALSVWGSGGDGLVVTVPHDGIRIPGIKVLT